MARKNSSMFNPVKPLQSGISVSHNKRKPPKQKGCNIVTKDSVYNFILQFQGTLSIVDISEGLSVTRADGAGGVIVKLCQELQMDGLVEMHCFDRLELWFVRAFTPVEIAANLLDKK